MQNSCCTEPEPAGQKTKGFAISIDALLATVITLGLLAFVGLGIETQDMTLMPIEPSLKNIVDDTFNALDNSGFLAEKLANAELRDELVDDLYEKATDGLPNNVELKIELREFRPKDPLDDCKNAYNDYFNGGLTTIEEVFTDCFLQLREETPFIRGPEPEEEQNEVFHGRKLAVMRQPVSEKTDLRQCILGDEEAWLKEKEARKTREMVLQGSLEADVETYVNMQDLEPNGSLLCDETANLILRARNRSRDPLAIMLAIDKSGSMEEYDMLVQEKTGSFNEGECENEPMWVPGYEGSALQFNSVSSYANCGNHDSLQITGDMTITFWAKPLDVDNPSRQNPLCKAYGAEFCFTMEPSGSLSYYHGSSGGNGPPYIGRSASNMFADNTWVHVALTRDLSTRTLQFYKNGSTTGSQQSWTSGYDPVPSPNYDVKIGDGYLSGAFNGIVDEIRIYDRKLDAGEISTIHAGGNAANGLVAHWKLNENEGRIASDSSGNGYACGLWNWANASGEPKWVSGKYGNALSFDGINDYIEMPHSTSLGITGPITISAWIKARDPNLDDYMRIASKGGYNAGYELEYSPYYNRIAVNGNGQADSTHTADFDASWHHIAGVIYGDGTGKVFADNADVTDDATVNSPPSNSDPLNIGRQDNGKDHFRGEIDDLRIYGRALTDPEIEDLFNGVDVAAGLVGHWKFDEASGNTASDSSGNGNNGTLMNWIEEGYEGCQQTEGGSSMLVSNCPTKKSNYSDYTNKQTVLNYDFTPIQDKIGANDWFDFISSSTGYDGVCIDSPNNNMGLWIERPDEVVEGDNSLYWERIFASAIDPASGTYDITVWSDEEINYYIWLRQRLNTNNSGTGEINSPQGTKDGRYIPGEDECENFGEWEKVATYQYDLLDYDKIYWQQFLVYYYNYNDDGQGQCRRPHFEVRHIDSSGQVDIVGTEYSCNRNEGQADGRCYVNPLNNGGVNGPFDQTGTYELWIWTDSAIDYTYYARAYNSHGIVFGEAGKTDTISGGTCQEEECYRSILPALPPTSNCPQTTGTKQESVPGLDATTAQDLNTFTVSGYLRGLRAWFSLDYSSASDAECDGAAIGFRNPMDGSDDPNWANWYAQKNNSTSGSIWVNNPSASSYWRWESGPPIPEGDYTITGWTEDTESYEIKWHLQRIDSASRAIKTFIDNAQWKSDDEIGLVEFSSNALLSHGLTDDREAVKDTLDNIETSGETAVADAIERAAEELSLNVETGTGKFMVLLTDGKANVCFGSEECSEETAIEDAITAAENARFEGITIYVIGFADSAIIGSYEEDLKEVALDKDDERFEEGCEDGTLSNCGKYYYAADEGELEALYNLIAFEIAKQMGSVDIELPFGTGYEIDVPNIVCGHWSQTTGDFIAGGTAACSDDWEEYITWEEGELKFRDQTILGENWWAAEIPIMLPCDAENCENDFILMPPAESFVKENGTGEVVEWDSVENDTIICSTAEYPEEHLRCHKKVPFNYADLNVLFTAGEITEAGDQLLNIGLEVDNNGFRDLSVASGSHLQVSFYKDDFDTQITPTIVAGTDASLMPSGTPVNLSSGTSLEANGPFTLLETPSEPWKLDIEGLEISSCPESDCSGTIIARINENTNVTECPLHNEAYMYCVADPEMRFYTLDYWAWWK